MKNRRAIDGYANGSYCYAASKSTKLKLPNSMKSAQELFAIIGFLSLVIALVSVLALDIIRGDFANRLQSKANADSMAGSGSNNSSTTNLATGPATISLSIASSTSSSGGSNISISSPSGGGIATGYHTLKVITNSDNGYDLSMKSSTADTSLKPSGSSNTNAIPSTTATLSSPSTLSTRTWGIALPDNSTYASFSELADYTSADASALSSTKYAAVPTTGTNIMSKSSATDDDTQNVVFGVNAKDPTQDEPDTYSIEVVYTATTNLPSAPTITTIQPSAYTIGDASTATNTSTINIVGTNLSTAYSVFIDFDRDGVFDSGEECTDLTVSSDTKITCKVPAITDNSKEGTYPVVIDTQSSSNATANTGFSYYAKSVCENGNSNSDCQVDIDDNMIPIKYDGNTTAPKWVKADVGVQGDWYDYDNKKWANAVTVASNKVDTYKNAAAGTEIPEDDILGYWVYIPRYAYEVMRPNAVDRVVPDQNFNIKFETADSTKYTKKSPKETCSSVSASNSGSYDSITNEAIDYRIKCNISRDYNKLDNTNANNTTWATHPAFTWGDTELNGIWVAKYETTGTQASPTVKPSVSSLRNMKIGDQYDTAIRMGVTDTTGNQYGNQGTATTQNYHNLSTTKSHMMKNSEWGAAVYLSASTYGAGVNKVQLNSFEEYNTGCGPQSDGDTSGGSTCNEYYTTLGQLASTTNNTYGLYDMAGGAWEYMMGGYSSNTDSSKTNGYVKNAVKVPYTDIYNSDIFTGTNLSNSSYCTWATCGGHALHEVKTAQTIDESNQSWGLDNPGFVDSTWLWFKRGDVYSHTTESGVFSSFYLDGLGLSDCSFRIILL